MTFLQLSGRNYFLRKTTNIILKLGGASGVLSLPVPHCCPLQKWVKLGPNVTLTCCCNTYNLITRNDVTPQWDALGGTSKSSLVTCGVAYIDLTWALPSAQLSPKKLSVFGWQPNIGVPAKEVADRDRMAIKVTGESAGALLLSHQDPCKEWPWPLWAGMVITSTNV